jgi:Fic family protein
MKKSLIETNPYLKDPELRKKLLRRSAISSSAIEGIYVSEEDLDRYQEKLALEEKQNKPVTE